MSLRNIALFSLICSLFLFPLPVRAERPANIWLERAIIEKNLEKKIEYYEKSLEQDPDDARTHNNVGVLYKKKGLLDAAIAHYEAALAIPGYKTPEYSHHNLGIAYKELRQYQKALAHFKAAVDYNPKFAKAFNGMGLTYKEMGEFEKAEEGFRRALELQPNYVQAEYNLRNVWKLPQDDRETEEKLEKIRAEAEKLAKEGDYGAAVEALREGLKLDPENAVIKRTIADYESHRSFEELYRAALKAKRMGKWTVAMENIEKALKLAVTQEEMDKISRLRRLTKNGVSEQRLKLQQAFLYDSGMRHLKNRDWLKAISAFTKVLMNDPDNEEVKEFNRQARVGYYYEEASSLISQGKWPEAEEKLRNLLELEPENERALALLTDVRDKVNARQVEYLIDKADQANNLGQWEQARRLYGEALRLAPDNQTAKIALEKLPEKNEKPVKAVGPIMEDWAGWVEPFVLISLMLVGLVFFYIIVRVAKTTHVLTSYQRFKDGDESRRLYEKMLKDDPGKRTVYPLLAEVYYDLAQDAKIDGLLARCEEYSKQVPRPEAAGWVLCMGGIFQVTHQFDKAAKLMEQALSMRPDDPTIRERLCQVYQTMLKQNYTPQLATRLAQLQQSASSMNYPVKQEDESVEDKLALLKECFARAKG